jgi:hypothetical protein
MTPSFDQRASAKLRTTDLPGATRYVADRTLLLLLMAVAFLLGCQELFDADVWWHVRSGQWILEEGRVPALDPFTFASADRAWVNLHWLFQVILATVFAAAGVRGVIVLTASLCAAVIPVVFTLRDRRWPSWLMAMCWLPALAIMSARFVPRPEIFSVLGMALYLTILLKVDASPALAWFLPLIQVLWVNTHGLFVLGPIILAAYVAGRLVRPVLGISEVAASRRAGGKPWRFHVAGAAMMVGAACLVNPYGLRGALFPLELFPKITAWGGLYKTYIIEFGDLRDLVRKHGPAPTGSLYLRTECFLLCAIPPSFIMPAVWRTSRAGRPAFHVGACGAALTLIAASALGFPALGTSDWMLWLGRLAAPAMFALGSLGAAVLVRTSRRAANLAFIGGLATAAWMIWLRLHLIGPEPGLAAWLAAMKVDESLLGWGTALMMFITAALVLRAGGSLFMLVIAVMFGYLALQAIRNMNLFGMASGIVLTSNFGGWTSDMASLHADEQRDRTASVFAGLAARLMAAALIVLMILAVVTGRFFRATGEPRGFGLRESPLAFAHDAARFAGQAGLPDRALAYDLSEAGVYLFHNGPQRKLFMDGRLEVPDHETFATYIRLDNMLNEGRRGWAELVRQMGDPLILLGHRKDFGAEATLLVDPGWRCIFFDAVASIFVSKSRSDVEAAFPSVDFAARHFRDPRWRAMPPEPKGIAEGKALLFLASRLQYRDGLSGSLPTSIELAAGDRFRQAIAIDRTIAAHWTLLGMSCWNMIADLKASPPGPAEPWDIARGILPAQATYCFRRALELDPGEQTALSSLARTLEARGTSDAESPSTNLPQGVVLDWATSDRVATTLLHLGRPADARQIWQRATNPPSPAVRQSRIATAALASQEFPAARDGFESALTLDPGLGEAWFGLALLHTQLGEAAEASAAIERGLRQRLTEPQAASLRVFQILIKR